MLIWTKKSTSSFILSLEIVKILLSCYFVQYGQVWQCPTRLMVLTCRIAWCLTACKKSSSYLPPSYLRYCKGIAKLLFWVLWACQAMTSKNNIPACRKLWWSSSGKKIIFTFDLFLEILQIYHKLAILGTLGFDRFFELWMPFVICSN